MTQEERDQLLLDLKTGQEKLFKGQDELFKGQDELFKGQEELSKGQKEILGRVENLEYGLKDTNQELKRLSQSVAKIEVDHGEKIQILLDVVTSHSKRFDSIDKRLESIETKADRHSDEIYYLNSKVHAF